LANVFTLLALTGLLWGGCTVSRHDINAFDFHDRITELEVGKTTSQELQDMIGSPPQSVLFTENDGRVWVYTFGHAKTAGLTLIVFNALKTNMGLDGALFLIDRDGIVRKHFVSNNSQNIPWEWWPFDENDDT
jgi:hypothetical protein